MKESNWRITRTGFLTILIILTAFLGLTLTQIEDTINIFLPIIGGILFGISSQLRNLDRISSIAKPLSEFLGMMAAALLITAFILFSTTSFELALEAFEETGADTITQYFAIVLVPLIGFKIAIFSTFISAVGATLLYNDGIGERVKLEKNRKQYVFPAILLTLAILTGFGTAIIQGISPIQLLNSLQEFLLSESQISGLLAGLILFFTYWISGDAWKLLPIRELIPRTTRNTYDKLKKPEKILRWIIIPLAALLLIASDWTELPGQTILNLITEPSTRNLLINLTTLSITLIILIKSLRLLKTGRNKIKKLSPYIVFALATYLIARFFSQNLETLISELPGEAGIILSEILEVIGGEPLILLILAAASIASLSIKSSMNLAKKVGLTPKSLEGVTLISAGIFFTSIGIYLYTSSTPNLLFIGVGASMLAWETGRRSVILGKEIGRKAETTRSELIRTSLDAIKVFVAILVARILHIGLQELGIGAPQQSGFAIFLFAIIGFIMLLFAVERLY